MFFRDDVLTVAPVEAETKTEVPADSLSKEEAVIGNMNCTD